MSLFLFLILTCFCASAQIAVASFSLLENDLTANTSGTMVTDQNGDKCALIKVETTQTGFTFNAGQLGVTKTEQHPGEIWVYVPAGVRRISISHPQLGVLRDYDLGMSVQKAKTYLLKLTTGTVTTIVEESLQSQYLIFSVSPADALVEVNQEMWQVNDGVARKLVPFGTYDYRIVAADYHPEVGKVTVNDANAKKQVSITLKPAFGWIEIGAGTNSDLKGANVYVDNKLVGSIPVKTERLASGSHSVKVVKELYKSLEQTVLVQDNQTTKFVPQMVADFGNVTLMVDNNAEIWVNDELKGKGRWSGKLASGEYLFEARLANHRKTTMRKIIAAQATMQTYTLQVPVPICGNLDVSSNPDFAEIWLDGKKVGETPMLLPKVLIGKHEIVFKKQGCGDFRQTITLAEGETKAVTGNLPQGREVSITAPQGAAIYVDGQQMATSQYRGTLSFGSHKVYAMMNGKRSLPKTLSVEQNATAMPKIALSFSKDQNFTVNGVTFKMVFVEGGTFTMGATQEQGTDASDDEKPTHSVTLSDYYIGQTEVTQALWEAVMGSNPSYFVGSKRPVERIGWNNCQKFVKKLKELTAKNFRLPTEAEWEYAARGGNKSKGYKYSGSNLIGEVAWYERNSQRETHPVGLKRANELGLYDMSGNVWEWVHDMKGRYSSEAQTNPIGSTDGSYVMRGGCFCLYEGRRCRVSARDTYYPDLDEGFYFGMRLALTSEIPAEEEFHNLLTGVSSSDTKIQSAERYYNKALKEYEECNWSGAWNSVNKAIDIEPGDMRFYNLQYVLLTSIISTIHGPHRQLDINVLVTSAIQIMTEAKKKCVQKGQEKEFEICENNIAEARKIGKTSAEEKAQLFMLGLSYGQMYQMQSGDVKLSAPLTEY